MTDEMKVDENLVTAKEVKDSLREIKDRLGDLWPEWCQYKFGKSSAKIESVMGLVSLKEKGL